MPSAGDQPRPSLRERKKTKTRAAIQRSALRLFAEQGYEVTTVEQIAEAAEVSPSTFFRYFPTKEDVALYDELDPLFIAAFEAQPANLNPVKALRGALRAVFSDIPAEDTAQQWERARLIFSVPELRMRMLDQVAGMFQLMAELIAKRTGRRADEPAVRAYAGAVIGTLLAMMFDGLGTSLEDFLERMDAGLAYLESGLPL